MAEYTAIIIDYYLQLVEAGCDRQGAEEQTHRRMTCMREVMKREDYLIAYELITRIAKA